MPGRCAGRYIHVGVVKADAFCCQLIHSRSFQAIIDTRFFRIGKTAGIITPIVREEEEDIGSLGLFGTGSQK